MLRRVFILEKCDLMKDTHHEMYQMQTEAGIFQAKKTPNNYYQIREFGFGTYRLKTGKTQMQCLMYIKKIIGENRDIRKQVIKPPFTYKKMAS